MRRKAFYGRQTINTEQTRAGLMDILDLPPGVVTRDVHIEMKGSREMYIDGCRSVILYEDGIISLDASGKKLTVEGEKLVLCSLSDDQLRIEGNIQVLKFE